MLNGKASQVKVEATLIRNTMEEVITELAVSNSGLKRYVSILSDKNQELTEEIVALKAELEKAVSFDFLEDFVKGFFDRGEIPLPDGVLGLGIPVSVSCSFDEQRSSTEGLRFQVSFSTGDMIKDGAAFMLTPVIDFKNFQSTYPTFSGPVYKKIVIPAARKHRKKAAEQKPVIVPKVDTST